MIKWFTSLRGAITLSAITWLTEAWRGFLDAMFILPVDIGDKALMNLGAVIFAALFGAWAWLIAVAASGSRRGLIGAFIMNAFVLLLIPISWLLFYCPAACRLTAGIFNCANTLNLVFGVLSGIALGVNIWGGNRKEA